MEELRALGDSFYMGTHLQCTLQLQFYQKNGIGYIVVCSTPAIVNIIIWWVHDCVVDRYTVFATTKS